MSYLPLLAVMIIRIITVWSTTSTFSPDIITTGFDLLPPKVITQILQDLTFQDLQSLSCTNQYFRRLTKYHRIFLDQRYDKKYMAQFYFYLDYILEHGLGSVSVTHLNIIHIYDRLLAVSRSDSDKISSKLLLDRLLNILQDHDLIKLGDGLWRSHFQPDTLLSNQTLIQVDATALTRSDILIELQRQNRLDFDTLLTLFQSGIRFTLKEFVLTIQIPDNLPDLFPLLSGSFLEEYHGGCSKALKDILSTMIEKDIDPSPLIRVQQVGDHLLHHIHDLLYTSFLISYLFRVRAHDIAPYLNRIHVASNTTFLHRAIRWFRRHSDLTQFMSLLKSVPGLDINVKDYSGRSPAHYYLWSHESTQHLDFFLNYPGFDRRSVCDDGDTILHKIARFGDETEKDEPDLLKRRDYIERLVVDCDVNARNKDGNTAAHLYIISGGQQALSVFFNCSRFDLSSVNNDRETVLHLAIRQGFLPNLSSSLPPSLFTEQNKFGFSPLHVAVNSNHIDIVKLLLQQYPLLIDINAKDCFGRTALHDAVTDASVEIVCLLLKHRETKIDPVNNYGETPVQIAKRNGNFRIVWWIRWKRIRRLFRFCHL